MLIVTFMFIYNDSFEIYTSDTEYKLGLPCCSMIVTTVKRLERKPALLLAPSSLYMM